MDTEIKSNIAGLLMYQNIKAKHMNDDIGVVIGFTGQPASGKDTAADFLISKGFLKVSGGDILREEMNKLNIPINRETINNFVASVRKEKGNGYLSLETIKRIQGNSVISGIRNTEEVKIFREKLGKRFFLIAVETPLEARFERAKKRNRAGDSISFEQFKKEEDKERKSESGSHEVDKVISMADFLIFNDGTEEEFFRRVEETLSQINTRYNGH